MYRCSVCNAVSQPGAPMARIVTLRADGNIARERPCCRRCQAALTGGRTAEELAAEFAVPLPAPSPMFSPRLAPPNGPATRVNLLAPTPPPAAPPPLIRPLPRRVSFGG